MSVGARGGLSFLCVCSSHSYVFVCLSVCFVLVLFVAGVTEWIVPFRLMCLCVCSNHRNLFFFFSPQRACVLVLLCALTFAAGLRKRLCILNSHEITHHIELVGGLFSLLSSKGTQHETRVGNVVGPQPEVVGMLIPSKKPKTRRCCIA